MYTSCLFCSSSLGSNDELEHLPVGKRVAFDPRMGRLWVVCPRCGRWNLCPFEERWEALEESERLSRRSAVRERGEELSLLRHPSGLSLIRVGRPTLAELVSWRFARSLVWRRRGYLAGLGVAGGIGGSVLLGVASSGGVLFTGLMAYGFYRTVRDARWPAVRMVTGDGRPIAVTATAARGATFITSESGDPVLHVDFQRIHRGRRQPHRIEGPDVPLFIARAMPHVNEEGATQKLAVEAARRIEERGGRVAFLRSVMGDHELLSRAVLRKPLAGVHRAGVLAKLPRPIRLAMEAASHVDQEERVLTGELEGVIAEWRDAERVADIADNLIEPAAWPALRARYRSTSGDDGQAGARG